jgi:amyloid beta precursor protein binding protein 1
MAASDSGQAPGAPAPEADDEVYDRQIRLWGPHGQAAIAAAHLYVLGSDCQATELLKTLVHGRSLLQVYCGS